MELSEHEKTLIARALVNEHTDLQQRAANSDKPEKIRPLIREYDKLINRFMED